MNTKRNGKWLVRAGLAATGTLAIVVLLLSWGMRTHAQNTQGHIPVHMTTDWSTRHMVYSAPSSTAQAWRLQAEPRYLHQLTRRNAAAPQAHGAR
jgi:hypothetical protein